MFLFFSSGAVATGSFLFDVIDTKLSFDEFLFKFDCEEYCRLMSRRVLLVISFRADCINNSLRCGKSGLACGLQASCGLKLWLTYVILGSLSGDYDY